MNGWFVKFLAVVRLSSSVFGAGSSQLWPFQMAGSKARCQSTCQPPPAAKTLHERFLPWLFFRVGILRTNRI